MDIQATQLRLALPGTSLSQIVSRIAPIFSGVTIGSRVIGGQIGRGGAAIARARQTAGPAGVPTASNAIRTTSVLGRTRAGLNLKGRDIAIIGGSTAALGITSLITQPGPSGGSAIETITRGAENIAQDVGPGLENATKFLQENGPIIALAIGGIVLIGLIK